MTAEHAVAKRSRVTSKAQPRIRITTKALPRIAKPRVGQHSCATPEHGTPPEIVELARACMGGIDFDPMSSAKWNRVVGATRYLTEQDDATKTPWFAGAPAPDLVDRLGIFAGAQRQSVGVRVLLNPAGDPKGELVAAAWTALAGYFELGWIRSAVYEGFSLEQASRLQRVGAWSHPLLHTTLFPEHRLEHQKDLGVAGEQPPHASFVTLLTRDVIVAMRFRELGKRFGCVVRGELAP